MERGRKSKKEVRCAIKIKKFFLLSSRKVIKKIAVYIHILNIYRKGGEERSGGGGRRISSLVLNPYTKSILLYKREENK